MLAREDGNSSFYLDYKFLNDDEMLLISPDSPCKVKAKCLLEKLHSGVGGNKELPAVYFCEHGPVTNKSFYKYSVPVSVVLDV